MQLRHITVLLLSVAAMLLGLAIFNYRWWEVNERGSKGGFGPLGMEECRDGKCESGSYTPLIVTLDVGSEDHAQWSRQQSRGRYVFGAGAATALLAIACVLATLAKRRLAGTLVPFGLAATAVVAVVGFMFLLQPHAMMEKLGFGRGVFLYWAGFLAAASGFLVSQRAEAEARAAPALSGKEPPVQGSPSSQATAQDGESPKPAVRTNADNPEGVPVAASAPGEDDDWKVPCRFCHQLIRPKARACVHCRQMLL